ncbi:MAG: hypothetical protein HY841_05410 [Bacteroidetes bacterium]|nr:hypothetical protein [Bacteroidota bacterium]
MRKNSSLKKVSKENTTKNLPAATNQEKIQVEYTNAFLLEGKKLQPLTVDYQKAIELHQSKPIEKKIKSESELEDIVLRNSKILFGGNTLLINLQEKTGIEFTGGFSPAGILLDFQDKQKPKLFLLEVFLSEKTFSDLFYQMTRLFSFFRDEESTRQFADALGGVIGADKALKKEFRARVGSGEIREVLAEILKRKPAVLLVTNNEKNDLPVLTETYTETWGKLVKPIFLRKFLCKGDTIITVRPLFSEINGKKVVKEGKVKSTVEDHLENVSEPVREIFLQIKKELLKADKELEFRVKQYYISMRKNRNLAFFQLGKKKLSVVIANPEKGMQKKIKHHKTLTLAPSVKKFWNGNEHCFTVVIESAQHLSEIINLLKKLVKDTEE